MSLQSKEAHLEALAAWCRQVAESGRLTEQSRQRWESLRQDAADTVQAGIYLPFFYLCKAFSLNDFEEFCLPLALAQEIDPDAPARLSAGLALRLYGGGVTQRRAFLLDAPLMRYCLQAESEKSAMLPTALRLEERLLAFLIEDALTDDALAAATLVQPDETVGEASALTQRMLHCARQNKAVVFLFSGADTDAQRETVLAFGAACAFPVLLLSAKELWELGAQGLRRLERECILIGAIPCLHGAERLLDCPDGEQKLARLTQTIAMLTPVCFVCSAQEWSPPHVEGVFLFAQEFPMPDLQARYALWGTAAQAYALSQEVSLAALAESYSFGSGQIGAILAGAHDLAWQRGDNVLSLADVTQVCHRQLSCAVTSSKMLRVPAIFGWDDLILPPRSKELLAAACQRIGNGHTVYHRWGFGQKLPYGAGLSMLFAGPPGTGKTMGAQVVARRLSLMLYKVNLAGVVSKYIGETEKNLEEIFRQAAQAQAILFFDEADVLFGKRTEIRESNDKYSNMEAAFLLQKMDEYEGITILATNYLQNFDEAFKRRIKYIIDFPFPDRSYRRLLWESAFPEETPLEEPLDLEFLAERFELTGSNIKNIAVGSAFTAAAAGKAVGMAEVIRALRMELSKSGKTVSREELGAYRMLWEEW